MLVAARTAVAGAPLWATIGAHLTFLTINRAVLEGNERDAGVSVDQTTPDAVLLVPAYLLVATVAFLAYGRIARRGSLTASSDLPRPDGQPYVRHHGG
ncbi:hypothetical protein [Streptomyces himastatinicus]|nr:hypothetical protein [Streptomyces himastatinicus]